jgi:predicted kinase
MKNLILLRGLPGSGKSTFAKAMWNELVVCEADQYFIDKETGEYKFNQHDLPKAHYWCQSRVETFMQDNHMNDQFYPRIVVANTFTQEWEMKPYYELALKYNYRVHSVIVENRHGNKSVHDVPDATMGNMLNRFEIKL